MRARLTSDLFFERGFFLQWARIGTKNGLAQQLRIQVSPYSNGHHDFGPAFFQFDHSSWPSKNKYHKTSIWVVDTRINFNLDFVHALLRLLALLYSIPWVRSYDWRLIKWSEASWKPQDINPALLQGYMNAIAPEHRLNGYNWLYRQASQDLARLEPCQRDPNLSGD